MRQPSLPTLFRFAFTPIAIAVAGLAPVATVLAADAPAGDEERVQVVGSRVAVRSESESAVPVDLISGDDLRKSGFNDVGTALESLAPSFNFAEMAINDGSDHVKPAMLRGLGPDQTLVLINGKRRHSSALIHTYSVGRGTAGTDLNAIPMAAVERIEILRDGASAQYGSDAIAGVINIVLKKSTGTELSEHYSVTDVGDGETFDTSINTGFGVGDGVINLTFNYKDAERTNRALPDPSGAQWHLGEPDLEQTGFVLNASIPVGDAELYGFATYTNRQAAAGAYFRCITAQADVNPDNYCVGIPDALTDVHPNGFLPSIESDVTDQSLAVGFRFDIGEWKADLSAVSGGNQFGFDVSNTQNFTYGYGPTGDAADVPTSTHAGELDFNQQTFNFDLSGELADWQLAFGVEMRKENFQIKAGDRYSWFDYATDPANVAWAEPNMRVGSQGFPGWSDDFATDIDRDSFALYAEAAKQLTEAFRIEAAVRHEDYEDFGTDISSKLAAYWQLTDALNLRASFSDGFRAPSLAQVGYSQFSSQIEGPNAVNLATLRIDSDIAQDFGIPDLEAEDSKSYTAGIVINPHNGLEVTLDVYRIEISDRITLTGNFRPGFSPEIDAILPDGIDAASFFTNAIDTETNGVDLIMNYRHDVGTGQLEYTFAASYNKTDVTKVDTIPGILSDNANDEIDPSSGDGLTIQDIYFDRRERAHIEDYTPHTRYTIGAAHIADGWRFGATANYYDEVKTVYVFNDPTYDYVDEAAWIFDLNLRREWENGLTLGVAINNVADEYPTPQHGPWNGNTLPYSLETSQWGLAGRNYSVDLSYSF